MGPGVFPAVLISVLPAGGFAVAADHSASPQNLALAH